MLIFEFSIFQNSSKILQKPLNIIPDTLKTSRINPNNFDLFNVLLIFLFMFNVLLVYFWCNLGLFAVYFCFFQWGGVLFLVLCFEYLGLCFEIQRWSRAMPPSVLATGRGRWEMAVQGRRCVRMEQMSNESCKKKSKILLWKSWTLLSGLKWVISSQFEPSSEMDWKRKISSAGKSGIIIYYYLHVLLIVIILYMLLFIIYIVKIQVKIK